MSSTRPAGPQAVLVAMDFSPSARRALDLVLAWYPHAETTALHVVDTDFAARIESEGLGGRAEVVAKRRARADEEFTWLLQERPKAFDPMIVEGSPVVEIVKLARDLQVDLIALGAQGQASRLDDLLFGSTAEKVLRTAHSPVLCVR